MSIQLSTGVLHVKDNGEYDTIDVLRAPYKAVDSQLSSTSENPVQNKVVKQALDGKVDDVQIDGNSIVTDGVANIPIAKTNDGIPGAVKIYSAYGIQNTSDYLQINRAGAAIIKSGNNNYTPIVPSNQHTSAFYGLTKAAGVDMASSDNPVGTYTEEAKIAIQKMLGIYEAPWELIREDTFTNTTQATHDISVDGNGQPFELTSAILMFETPTQATQSKANGNLVLSDGSSFLTSMYTSAWTQEANAIAHGCWIIAERKGDLVFISMKAQASSDTSYGTSIMQGYGEGFQGVRQSIVESTNFIVRQVKIAQVLGTGHYKLYGKRKWQ